MANTEEEKNLQLDLFIKSTGLSENTELRKYLIKQVFRNLSGHSSKSAKEIGRDFSEIELPGFRKGKAPEHKMINKCSQNDFWHAQNPLLQKIFDFWIEINYERIEQAKNIINDLDTDEFINFSESLMVEELQDNFNSLVNNFISHNQCNEDEPIELFLCAAFLKIKQNPTIPKLWTEAIIKLNSLQLDSDEWVWFDAFVRMAQDIRDAKENEQTPDYQQIEKLIDTLREECKKVINYIGKTQDVLSWDAFACPPDHIDEVVEQIELLKSELKEIDEPLPTFSSYEEEENVLENRKRIRLKIIELFAKIDEKVKQSNVEIDKKTNSEIEITDDDSKTRTAEKESEVLDPSKESELEDSNEYKFATEKVDESAEDCIRSTKEDEDIFGGEIAPKGFQELSENIEEASIEIDKERIPFEAPDNDTEDVFSYEEKEDEIIPSKELKDQELFASSKLCAEDCLQDPKNTQKWHTLFYTLIRDDDLAGAYWICRFLETQVLQNDIYTVHKLINGSNSQDLPSEFISVVNCCRLIEFEQNAVIGDLKEVASRLKTGNSVHCDILSLSSALPAILIGHALNFLDWLKIPPGLESVRDIVTGIRSFVGKGFPLSADLLVGVADHDKIEKDIKGLVDEAEDFLKNAPNKRLKISRTKNIWIIMITRNGDLYNLLDIVKNDKREQLPSLIEYLDEFDSSTDIMAKFARLEGNSGRHLREIVGSARANFISCVEDVLNIARRWKGLVELDIRIREHGDWINNQVKELRNIFLTTLPSVSEELQKLLYHDLATSSAATCLWRSLMKIQSIFKLSVFPPLPEKDYMNDWKWLLTDYANMQTVTGNRLLWVPKIHLNHERQPSEFGITTVKEIAKSINEKANINDLFQKWLDAGDYRYMSVIKKSLDNGENDWMDQQIRDQMSIRRETFRKTIEETNTAIEQSVVDGIIAEERSEYQGKLLLIDYKDTLDFVAVKETIDNINQSLNNARFERLNDLKKKWAIILPQIKNSQIDSKKIEKIEHSITERLNIGDTRVVEENLSFLEDYLERGIELEDELFSLDSKQDDSFEMFIEKMEALNELLKNNPIHQLPNKVREERSFNGVSFKGLIRARINEVADVFETWGRLKNGKPSNVLEIRKNLLKIIRYLGFTIDPEKAKNAVRDRTESNWWHGQIFMSAGKLILPFPQFGSMANNQYDIVCFWGRPDPSVIATKLKTFGVEKQCVIVIFLGALTKQQRESVFRTSRHEQLAMAILDETLLIYISQQEQDQRLSVLLRCSLPYSALNPYTPFKAGNVPPEIFFGRKDMIRQLQDMSGSCFVYGGRQLGKSALLRRVEIEFHNPQRENYACMIDIKLIGDPGTNRFTDSIWDRIRDAFKEFGLIGEKVTTDKPDDVVKYVRTALTQKLERQVLLLFDEADNFLEADAAESFQMVERMRILMSDTNRRFKVVFAGLHSVQKYQGIPNQPLAHFGRSICVGPLDPKAARKLVEEPFSALGYRFDDATTLRILSYTNYHPGLIQLFCQELLNTLHKQYSRTQPPYWIEQKIVESVYRQEEVYRGIKERFDWTLSLDPKYQAIAWSLIVEQIDDKDSYSQAYSAADLLALVQGYWLQGFKDMDIGSLRGHLDEMIGLGVLVRDRNNRYRLRSPNLVRIMGTHDDIIGQLDELQKKTIISPYAADDYHVPLDNEAVRFSPLTHAEERRINNQKSGTVIIFCSKALGFDDLKQALSRLSPPKEEKNKSSIFEDILINDANYLEIYEILEKIWQKSISISISTTFIRIIPECRNPESLKFLIENALKFSETRLSKHRWLRIIFCFDPVLTKIWFDLPRNIVDEFENRSDAIIEVDKLSILGIQQRLKLSRPEKVYTNEICQEVLEVTNGWPILINELFHRSLKETDPRPAANQIRNELMSPESSLSGSFKNSLSIEVAPEIMHALKTLIEWDEALIPMDLFMEQLRDEMKFNDPKRYFILEYLRRFGIISIVKKDIHVDPIVRGVFNSK